MMQPFLAHPFDSDRLHEECGVFGVIGVAEAANFVALGLHALQHRGQDAAERTRIIYGGSVTPENGPQLIGIDDVDGLFVGRAAWTPEGFARIIEIVASAARSARQPD